MQDNDTDMFQIGRSSEGPIDFVVMDTIPGFQRNSRENVTQSTISRFACRIIVDRNPPYTAKIFAAGFDSARNIFLGVRASIVWSSVWVQWTSCLDRFGDSEFVRLVTVTLGVACVCVCVCVCQELHWFVCVYVCQKLHVCVYCPDRFTFHYIKIGKISKKKSLIKLYACRHMWFCLIYFCFSPKNLFCSVHVCIYDTLFVVTWTGKSCQVVLRRWHRWLDHQWCLCDEATRWIHTFRQAQRVARDLSGRQCLLLAGITAHAAQEPSGQGRQGWIQYSITELYCQVSIQLN